MTKVVTTDNSGNIACAAEICDLISDCASIPHNKSLKVVGTELQLTDTLNDVIKCDVADLINKPDTPSVTNVKLYSAGKLLKLEDSAGDTVSNNMVSNAQACLPDLTYSFLPDTSVPTGALMLLDATGKPAKRADLADLADGTTVTYNETTGKFSATQGTPTPPAEYTTASEIPAKITDDASGTSPAAVVKMLKYLRPSSSTGGYTAEQSSANAIDVQVFNNVTCDGSGNITSFKIPKPGSATEFCTVTIPQGSGGGGTTPTAGTVVWEGLSNGCISLAGKGAGLYMVYLRNTWDEQWGTKVYYAIPIIFFDTPDTFDSWDVSTDYGHDSNGNQIHQPNSCTVITARMYTEVARPYNNGEGSVTSYIYVPNIVYQSFKSGLKVQDATAGHKAHVYKVVKLT